MAPYPSLHRGRMTEYEIKDSLTKKVHNVTSQLGLGQLAVLFCKTQWEKGTYGDVDFPQQGVVVSIREKGEEKWGSYRIDAIPTYILSFKERSKHVNKPSSGGKWTKDPPTDLQPGDIYLVAIAHGKGDPLQVTAVEHYHITPDYRHPEDKGDLFLMIGTDESSHLDDIAAGWHTWLWGPRVYRKGEACPLPASP